MLRWNCLIGSIIKMEVKEEESRENQRTTDIYDIKKEVLYEWMNSGISCYFIQLMDILLFLPILFFPLLVSLHHRWVFTAITSCQLPVASVTPFFHVHLGPPHLLACVQFEYPPSHCFSLRSQNPSLFKYYQIDWILLNF